MKACKFYTASSNHFAMHNNLVESSEYKFVEPLPFESCSNTSIQRELGTNQAQCLHPSDNPSCSKYEKEEYEILRKTSSSSNGLNRMILTRTRTAYGFSLLSVMKAQLESPNVFENLKIKTLHTFHSGTFDSMEEFEQFALDVFEFEANNEGYERTSSTTETYFERNVIDKLNSDSYSKDSFFEKVFANV